MNRVREFRQKMNLSQNALAKEIGVARQTINLMKIISIILLLIYVLSLLKYYKRI